ncbi:Large cysteine-rich periplasmic protein OmcB precursor [Thalassoglobus neptunius]|uniref:Large cysteine-rich periplasmic protein OmcB n=1 Tax=Thalassoglobus neptunius TaxID=1938619 RepID=A0A5C5WLH8_9PLAN|nr:DUF11 domain-containing protein [Thalassoglobus neptunius]TWT51530.1 Large cysteine-rich periplasmic protein OmcB precursor [Thalassoglobus neptunius]
MQNLIVKSLVLMGVIGGSCFVVWKAHESLQKNDVEPDPSAFTALNSPSETENETPKVAGNLFQDVEIDFSDQLDERADQELEPTLAESVPEPVSNSDVLPNHQFALLDPLKSSDEPANAPVPSAPSPAQTEENTREEEYSATDGNSGLAELSPGLIQFRSETSQEAEPSELVHIEASPVPLEDPFSQDDTSDTVDAPSIANSDAPNELMGAVTPAANEFPEGGFPQSVEFAVGESRVEADVFPIDTGTPASPADSEFPSSEKIVERPAPQENVYPLRFFNGVAAKAKREAEAAEKEKASQLDQENASENSPEVATNSESDEETSEVIPFSLENNTRTEASNKSSSFGPSHQKQLPENSEIETISWEDSPAEQDSVTPASADVLPSPKTLPGLSVEAPPQLDALPVSNLSASEPLSTNSNRSLPIETAETPNSGPAPTLPGLDRPVDQEMTSLAVQPETLDVGTNDELPAFPGPGVPQPEGNNEPVTSFALTDSPNPFAKYENTVPAAAEVGGTDDVLPGSTTLAGPANAPAAEENPFARSPGLEIQEAPTSEPLNTAPLSTSEEEVVPLTLLPPANSSSPPADPSPNTPIPLGQANPIETTSPTLPLSTAPQQVADESETEDALPVWPNPQELTLEAATPKPEEPNQNNALLSRPAPLAEPAAPPQSLPEPSGELDLVMPTPLATPPARELPTINPGRAPEISNPYFGEQDSSPTRETPSGNLSSGPGTSGSDLPQIIPRNRSRMELQTDSGSTSSAPPGPFELIEAPQNPPVKFADGSNQGLQEERLSPSSLESSPTPRKLALPTDRMAPVAPFSFGDEAGADLNIGNQPLTNIQEGEVANNIPDPQATPEAKESESNNELIGQGTIDRDVNEGDQSPELTIEKKAPASATIDEPLIYSILIKNVGGSPAKSLVVEDRIPKGTKLKGTIPQASLSNGVLTWERPELQPGDVWEIQLLVIPMEAGEIGSVATVSFEAAVAARIRVTAPKIELKMQGPKEAVTGKTATYQMTITNSGEGSAKEVYLRTILPELLSHPGGRDIEYRVGDLPAGESRSIDLVLTAEAAGVASSQALVTVNGETHAETHSDLRILDSRIGLIQSGPKRGFVGRPIEMTSRVTNLSSQRLSNVKVIERIPVGLSPAQPLPGWDAEKRVLIRNFEVLEAGESRDLKTPLVPDQAGSLSLSFVARDDENNIVEAASTLEVKGFADLDIDVLGQNQTVLVGDQVSFRLKLKNDGTAAAENVLTQFVIPDGLTFTSAKGPSQYQVQGNRIVFQPVAEVGMGDTQEFDIVLTAAGACNSKVGVELMTADYSEPIRFEKPVRVVGETP